MMIYWGTFLLISVLASDSLKQ